MASLYLVAQRRAGRPTGWVPWAALFIATSASLAANVAVGGDDPLAQALAGWPAVSMLVSVKLLFSMLDHTATNHSDHNRAHPGEQPRRQGPAAAGPVPDGHQSTVPDVPDGRRTVPDGDRSVPDDQRSSGEPSPAARRRPAADAPNDRPTDAAPSELAATFFVPRTPSPLAVAGDRAAPVTGIHAVADLIPAAQAARAALATDGHSPSRDALARALRQDGHALSNARASLLTKILRDNAV